jgi:murein DD-endopeptidase MepM/ murein hydrolase activator NlpD
MRWALFLLSVAAVGQSFRVEPRAPRQGDVIRITAPANAATARMGRVTISLFALPAGERFGLMPVSANDKVAPYNLLILDDSGAVLHTASVRVRSGGFLTQNVRLRPEVQALQPSPDEMQTVSAFRKTVTAERHWDEPFVRPIDGCMSSPYGVRRLHNGKPTGRYHGGLDQAAPEGTPVKAIAGGVVRVVREFNVHGHTVGVDHGQGLSSLYLHLSRFEAKEGSTVRKGDVIGYVGSTGRSTAPHLHWTLYANGIAVNPSRWVDVPACAAPKRQPARAKPAPQTVKKGAKSTRSK